jgi:localization factor PodJL
VVGSVQIGGRWLLTGHQTRTAKVLPADVAKPDAAEPGTKPAAPLSLAAELPQQNEPQGSAPALDPPASGIAAEALPPPDLSRTAQQMPPLFDPPLLQPKTDITGSITHPAAGGSPPPAHATHADELPAGIGGIQLRSAAVAGDAAAAYEIGVRFAEGRGVAADLPEAAYWLERAASKGLPPAQFRLASLLEKGMGVKKDIVRARRLYLAAAARGNAKAMHNLAVLYAEGADGKPDYVNAAQWFRKAANAGVSDSQFNLGVLAARGLGVEKSMTESYKWFALAAGQGDREAAKKRDDVAGQMDEDDLAAAKREVATFKVRRPPNEAVLVPPPPGGWDHAAEQHSPKARPKPGSKPAGPLSLGSFTVGNR